MAFCPLEVKLTTGRKLGTTMVDISVETGNKKRQFLVHKKLLCEKSTFFDKMFNGNFEEAKENKATFPEDNPDAVSALIDMLVYHNNIRSIAGPSDPKVVGSMAWDPVEVYALAEKWCFPTRYA